MTNSNQNTVVKGKQYFYKLKDGRGRPYVGEVVSTGLFVRIKNLQSGEVHSVVPRRVGGEYSFQPYNTKRRQAAA